MNLAPHPTNEHMISRLQDLFRGSTRGCPPTIDSVTRKFVCKKAVKSHNSDILWSINLPAMSLHWAMATYEQEPETHTTEQYITEVDNEMV